MLHQSGLPYRIERRMRGKLKVTGIKVDSDYAVASIEKSSRQFDRQSLKRL